MEIIEVQPVSDEAKILASVIAGGHPDRFRLDPEEGDRILVKKTNMYEIESYEKVCKSKEDDPRFEANTILSRFLPRYYGHFKEGEASFIKLENLLHGKDHASILDIKMGTTSITTNTPAHRFEEIRLKDE